MTPTYQAITVNVTVIYGGAESHHTAALTSSSASAASQSTDVTDFGALCQNEADSAQVTLTEIHEVILRLQCQIIQPNLRF